MWSCIGDSVTGTSHVKSNLPCQDAFRFRTFGVSHRCLVVAVADGAGSATHSGHGALHACDEFVRRVTETPDSRITSLDHAVAIFSEVRESLIVEAGKLNVPLREMACTALLAVICPGHAVFAQIGDGAMVCGRREEYEVVFWPEPMEYANGTNFLTDATFAESLRFESSAADISDFAVMTDGLQRVALDFSSRTAFQGFFRPLFSQVRQIKDAESILEPLRRFLDSERINLRTEDDKTLVIACLQK